MAPRIPAVVIPADEPDAILTVGIPEMTFDGQPFPFDTVGDWSLTFSKDSVAVLTVSIPVRLASKDDD
jgi:hypothetical protein